MIRNILPLGEQIIIKVLPPDQIGSIIVPDSAKGITQTGAKGAEDAVHFVEAEVVAVGPGKRVKDRRLLSDMAYTLEHFLARGGVTRNGRPAHPVEKWDREQANKTAMSLLDRVDNQDRHLPLQVKPGDRILYHPAVQRFDRRVEGLGEGEFYIIREESVLAVLEKE